MIHQSTTIPKLRNYNPLEVYAKEKVAILEKTIQKIMTIKIYDQDTGNYIEDLYLSGNNNKKEIEQNIKEYYNLNKIYYSIA